MSETLLTQTTRDVEALADIAYAVGCGLNTSTPWAAKTNYPAEWIQVYVREGFQSNDPLLAHMCKGRGAINWSDVPLDDLSRPMMERARDFGLSNGTVFANLLMGTKCSVSICHSKPELTEDEISVLERFTVVYAMHHPRPGPAPKDEVYLRFIHLAANGASNDEIQDALNVSYRALGTIKKEAIEAMGAFNLPHAITNAIDSHLI